MLDLLNEPMIPLIAVIRLTTMAAQKKVIKIRRALFTIRNSDPNYICKSKASGPILHELLGQFD